MSKLELPSLEELLEAGAHFGHLKERTHPSMRPFIFIVRDNVSIINLEKTVEKLEEALEFAEKTIKGGGTILFVGTKRQAKDLIKKSAEKTQMSYVTERWLGGTLTNFETLRKSLKKLKDLKVARETGEFEKYTKFEQQQKEEEIANLELNIGGIAFMTKLPDALFVIDTVKEKVAVAEANKLNIPVIALADTNSDVTKISYPIPANDDAIKTLELLIGVITAHIKESRGKKEKNKDEKISPPSGEAGKNKDQNKGKI